MKLLEILNNVKKFVISWFVDIRFYNFGLILWGDSAYRIKGPQIRQVLNLLQPGDILLRKYDHYLGSVLIKGFWSHAAVYTGNNEVVHMLNNGIVTEDILTFICTDHIMILRHKDKYMAGRICSRAKDFSDDKIEYDYDLDTNNNSRMYCTEFVDICADGVIKACVKKDSLIFPDDLLKCSSLEKIWSDLEIE
jgi:hypothetical protein